MKNTFKMLMVLSICALMFSSCKKEVLEGQYNPDKKPSVIRTADIHTDDGVETESFVQLSNFAWNGDLLSSITTINEITGNGLSKLTFTYDSKKRVEKVLYESDYNFTYKFTYNDKELAKVERYDESNEKTDEYLFTKTDGKVTQITHIEFGDDDKKGEFAPLRLLFSQQIADAMEMASTVSRADNSVYNLTWEGNNITKIELVSGSSTIVTDYTYDDKVNPEKGLYRNAFYSNAENLYSANNILTANFTLPLIGDVTSTHTYEYNGNYPVKETVLTHTESLLIPVADIKQIITYTYLQ